ncbi:hypothetical protein ACWY4P_00570 [Streptomyces sp. LZ34]
MLACAITLGATNVLQAEQLQYHWQRLFPQPVSDSTLWRALEAIDRPVAARVDRVRAAIRRVVWTLLALRPGGFPWIAVCGRELTGWYALDLDATIVQPAPGALGDRLGHQRHRRGRDRTAARERVDGRAAAGRRRSTRSKDPTASDCPTRSPS